MLGGRRRHRDRFPSSTLYLPTKIMTGTPRQGDRWTDRRKQEGGELTLRKETT